MQTQSAPMTGAQTHSVFRVLKVKRNCPAPRLTWTKAQDEYLLQLIPLYGEKHWKKTVQEMKLKFPDFPINGKKCRERWLNIGRPGIDKKPLTEQEELMLLAYHHVYSNSWASIAKKVPHRNPSTLKNNFYAMIKKTARQVSFYAGGEPISAPTPLQFYSSLYITAQLTELMVMKDPGKNLTIDRNNSKTPPHIAEYVYQFSTPLSTYKSYLMVLKQNCGTYCWNCSPETLETLKGLPYDELMRLNTEVSAALPEIMPYAPPNEAVSRAIEKVLKHSLPKPTCAPTSPQVPTEIPFQMGTQVPTPANCMRTEAYTPYHTYSPGPVIFNQIQLPTFAMLPAILLPTINQTCTTATSHANSPPLFPLSNIGTYFK